ncbi:hypothetical protein GNZ12_24230 [Paraburkholderia sp. 1N]|uniref:Uncharacterized protein n=1 Tax=Paraburkholderia solitsugae TaxID=2675748 RepID=A0ABX2BU18_9BURK|nr:hypothetical protein [Paraburkholderia solitsugae]NPT44362.1 hypothetical protein [Paraburkholderia solitsugae]
MTSASFQTRAQVLEDTRPLVERYLAQAAAGITTKLSQSQFKELVAYREAVLDTDNGAELPAAPAFVVLTV